jgi:hypothetical protein
MRNVHKAAAVTWHVTVSSAWVPAEQGEGWRAAELGTATEELGTATEELGTAAAQSAKRARYERKKECIAGKAREGVT